MFSDGHTLHQRCEQRLESAAQIGDNFIRMPITCRKGQHTLYQPPTSRYQPHVNEIPRGYFTACLDSPWRDSEVKGSSLKGHSIQQLQYCVDLAASSYADVLICGAHSFKKNALCLSSVTCV